VTTIGAVEVNRRDGRTVFPGGVSDLTQEESMFSRSIRTGAALTIAGLGVLATGGLAFADDHLANGATSPGAEVRGFTNPVALNPSGTSGAAAQPGTVPGLGNPSAGGDLGTPAFDCQSLQERLAARSMGGGPTCQ